jgi:hypothetical protein
VAVTGHHARLGSWLLAKLYHSSYLKLQNFMRLQGATSSEPDLLLAGLKNRGKSVKKYGAE